MRDLMMLLAVILWPLMIPYKRRRVYDLPPRVA